MATTDMVDGEEVMAVAAAGGTDLGAEDMDMDINRFQNYCSLFITTLSPAFMSIIAFLYLASSIKAAEIS